MRIRNFPTIYEFCSKNFGVVISRVGNRLHDRTPDRSDRLASFPFSVDSWQIGLCLNGLMKPVYFAILPL
jgi:hypothetical protein